MDIETESIYIEKTSDISEKNKTKYILNTNINFNFCCFVKSIYKSIDKKFVYIILENLFDLNSIILEIPRGHEILENIHINCIELFINFNIFIDEKLNIKLGLKNNMNEQSKVILLYYLVDLEKYNNKKINDILIKDSFNQLLSLITDNILIRTVQKYCVIVIILIELIIFIYIIQMKEMK